MERERVILETITRFYENPEDPNISKIELDKFRFVVNEVIAFNAHPEKGWTTIRFKNGDSFAIAVDYCSFSELHRNAINAKEFKIMNDKALYEFNEQEK